MAGEAPAPSETTAAATEVKKASLLAKLKVPLFVAVVIGVECLIAYLYLPSASDAQVMADVAYGGQQSLAASEAAESSEEASKHPAEHLEVDLGEFNVTAFQPASNSTLRIVFHLFGTITVEDQEEYAKRMEENRHRVREQVLVTVRGAEITDLTDAGLGLIKRTILEKTNRILGKPLLRSIVFSDFSFIEQ